MSTEFSAIRIGSVAGSPTGPGRVVCRRSGRRNAGAPVAVIALTTSGTGDRLDGIACRWRRADLTVDNRVQVRSAVNAGLEIAGSCMALSSVWLKLRILPAEDAEEDLLVDDQVDVQQARFEILAGPVEIGPLATGPMAPIIWLGTSKNSNILNQPSRRPRRPMSPHGVGPERSCRGRG